MIGKEEREKGSKNGVQIILVRDLHVTEKGRRMEDIHQPKLLILLRLKFQRFTT